LNGDLDAKLVSCIPGLTETFDYGWFDAFMKGVILSMNILMSASKITIFYISEFELYVSILGYNTLYKKLERTWME
jgi:hypothetical protein